MTALRRHINSHYHYYYYFLERERDRTRGKYREKEGETDRERNNEQIERGRDREREKKSEEEIERDRDTEISGENGLITNSTTISINNISKQCGPAIEGFLVQSTQKSHLTMELHNFYIIDHIPSLH